MYRIRIVERTLTNGDPLWKDYQKIAGIPYEEEIEENALIEMAHILQNKGSLQIELINVVKTIATFSTIPVVPIP